MAVLDTLYFLFDSDASKVKKGADEAERSVDSLEKSLNSSSKKSDQLGNSLQNVVRQLGGAVLAYVSIGSVLNGFRNAIDFADKLDELSKGVNISTEDLSAWGDAVHIAGGTAEGFRETVKSVSASLSQFAVKGSSRAAPFFQELGIKMVDASGKVRNFIDLLPEIADAFQKIGKEESFGIGQKMGLDQGTILLLQQGRRAVEDIIKRQKELGVVTAADAEIAAKFNDQWDDTTHMFRTLYVSLSASILPVFSKFLKLIENLGAVFRKHKDLMIGGLIGIGVAATAAAIPLLLLAAPFIKIGLAVGGLIALIAILYDDIRGFYKGSDSLLGQMIEKWPIVGTILKTIEGVVKDTWDLLTEIGNAVITFWQIVWDNIGPVINGIVKGIGKIAEAYQGVKEFFANKSAEYKVRKELINTSQAFLNRADTSPISATSSAAIAAAGVSNSNRNTEINIGEVKIETQATDVKGMQGAVRDYLGGELQQAVANYDDGRLS